MNSEAKTKPSPFCRCPLFLVYVHARARTLVADLRCTDGVALHTDTDGGDEAEMDALLLASIGRVPSRRAIREATRLFEVLLVAGVSAGDARAKIAELYSPPRVSAAAGTLPNLSLVGGSTFDLRADADGRSWDFRRAADRRLARARIEEEKPYLVVGCPPCTAFSALQALNERRADASLRARQLAEARVLLGFAIEIY